MHHHVVRDLQGRISVTQKPTAGHTILYTCPSASRAGTYAHLLQGSRAVQGVASTPAVNKRGCAIAVPVN